MTDKPISNRRDDDSLWKDLLERFFVPMLKAVLPDMARDLDRSKSVEFLNKEMTSLALNTQKDPVPKQYVDMLADVPLITGEIACVLLHIEVQGGGGKEDLPTRMNRYRSILEARYHRPIVGLAIITCPIGKKQSQGLYSWEMYGTKLTYQYSVLKAYEGDKEKLAKSANPFHLAHLAAIKAWQCQRKNVSKFQYLKRLAIILRDRGWEIHEKSQLLRFMEGIIHIYDPNNPEEYLKWLAFLEKEKEEGAMYVSLMERQGIEKGREQGLIQTAIKMLDKNMDLAIISELTGLSMEKVQDISRNRDKYTVKLDG
ncbi:MAG: hypothetical protein EOM02_12350 [Synergistales bacterium]|nr:hypothetical protein [Synergistales bacterium]